MNVFYDNFKNATRILEREIFWDKLIRLFTVGIVTRSEHIKRARAEQSKRHQELENFLHGIEELHGLKEFVEKLHRPKEVFREIKIVDSNIAGTAPIPTALSANEIIEEIRRLKEDIKKIKITGTNITSAGPLTGVFLADEGYGPEWELLSRYIRARDNYTCQEMDGNCHGPLHVHHSIPLSRGGTNSESNLVTLCEYHHSLKHPHMLGGKRDNIRRNFRRHRRQIN